MNKSKEAAKAAKVVAPPPPPAKGTFDPKQWAKNGVSEEEVISCKTAFDLFDSDQGGSIDLKCKAYIILELKAAMTSLGFESKNVAIFQMIADLDTDGNGSIDFGEWLTLMTKRVNDKDTRANVTKIFLIFDNERTGYISAKNLRKIANELGENISDE